MVMAVFVIQGQCLCLNFHVPTMPNAMNTCTDTTNEMIANENDLDYHHPPNEHDDDDDDDLEMDMHDESGNHNNDDYHNEWNLIDIINKLNM